MTENKTVLFRGPALTQSGYGVHSRQVIKWLLSRQNVELHVQALPWGETPWIIDANAYDGLIGKILSATGPLNKKADITFQLQLPNEWDASLGNFNVGITAGVETDKSNPEWIDACNKMDHIIVPSEHTKKSLMAAGTLIKPVSVIPESFCDAIIKENHDPNVRTPTFKTAFNFLIFGQLTGTSVDNDRKNTFNTIKWLCEKFKDDQDVGIVLKTNAGRNTKIDRLFVKNSMKQLLTAVRSSKFPRFYLLHGDMSDEEVVAMLRYPTIKGLVTLTRGEGFGLPILEAAACDLPVIATSWSGHTDFMKLGKYTEIDYQLKPVPQSRIDGKIFMPGSRWAETDEEDFKKRIQKFRDSSVVPKEWAKDLGKIIREKYSFDSIYKQYDDQFGNVL